MSGAVKTAASVATKALEIYNKPTQFYKDTIIKSGIAGEGGNKFINNWNSESQYWQKGSQNVADGKGVAGFIQGTAGANFKDTKSQAGIVKNIIDPKEAPATIVAEDPAVVADKAAKEKARAKRQAEIDILTDRPGRGGTILTDQYQYKV